MSNLNDREDDYLDIIKLLEVDDVAGNIDKNNDLKVKDEKKDEKCRNTKTANVAPLRATVAPIRNETILSTSTTGMPSISNNCSMFSSKIVETTSVSNGIVPLRSGKKDDVVSCSIAGGGATSSFVSGGNGPTMMAVSGPGSLENNNGNNIAAAYAAAAAAAAGNPMFMSNIMQQQQQHNSLQYPQSFLATTGGAGGGFVCVMTPPPTQQQSHQQQQQQQQADAQQFLMARNMFVTVPSTCTTAVSSCISNTSNTGTLASLTQVTTPPITSAVTPSTNGNNSNNTGGSINSGGGSSSSLPKLLPKPQNITPRTLHQHPHHPHQFFGQVNPQMGHHQQLNQQQQHCHAGSVISSATISNSSNKRSAPQRKTANRPRNSSSRNSTKSNSSNSSINNNNVCSTTNFKSSSTVNNSSTPVVSHQSITTLNSSTSAATVNAAPASSKDNVLMAWETAEQCDEQGGFFDELEGGLLDWSSMPCVAPPTLSNQVIYPLICVAEIVCDEGELWQCTQYRRMQAPKFQRASVVYLRPLMHASVSTGGMKVTPWSQHATIERQQPLPHVISNSVVKHTGNNLMTAVEQTMNSRVMQLLCAHIQQHQRNSGNNGSNESNHGNSNTSSLLRYLLPSTITPTSAAEPLSICTNNQQLNEIGANITTTTTTAAFLTEDEESLMADISPAANSCSTARRNPAQLARLDLLLERSSSFRFPIEQQQYHYQQYHQQKPKMNSRNNLPLLTLTNQDENIEFEVEEEDEEGNIEENIDDTNHLTTKTINDEDVEDEDGGVPIVLPTIRATEGTSSNTTILPYNLSPDERLSLEDFQMSPHKSAAWLKRSKHKGRWISCVEGEVVKNCRTLEVIQHSQSSYWSSSPHYNASNLEQNSNLYAKKKSSWEHNTNVWDELKRDQVKAKQNQRIKQKQKYRKRIEKIRNICDNGKESESLQHTEVLQEDNYDNNENTNYNADDNKIDYTHETATGSSWTIAEPSLSSSSGALKIRLKLNNSNKNYSESATTEVLSIEEKPKTPVQETIFSTPLINQKSQPKIVVVRKPSPQKRRSKPRSKRTVGCTTAPSIKNKKKQIARSSSRNSTITSVKKSKKPLTVTPLISTSSVNKRKNSTTSPLMLGIRNITGPNSFSDFSTTTTTDTSAEPSPKKIFCTRKEERRSSAALTVDVKLAAVGESTTLSSSGGSSVKRSPHKQTKRHMQNLSYQQQPLHQQLQHQQRLPPVLQSNLPLAPPPASSGSMRVRIKRTTQESASVVVPPSKQTTIPPVSSSTPSPLPSVTKCLTTNQFDFHDAPSSDAPNNISVPQPPMANIIIPPMQQISKPTNLTASISFSPAPSSSDSDSGAAHNEISHLLQRQEYRDPTSASAAAAVVSGQLPVPYLVGSSPTVFIDENKVDIVVVKNSSYKKVVAAAAAVVTSSSTSSGITTKTFAANNSSNTGVTNNTAVDVTSDNTAEVFLPGCFMERHQQQQQRAHSSPSMPVLAPQEPLSSSQQQFGTDLVNIQQHQTQQSPLCMNNATANTPNYHQAQTTNNNSRTPSSVPPSHTPNKSPATTGSYRHHSHSQSQQFHQPGSNSSSSYISYHHTSNNTSNNHNVNNGNNLAGVSSANTSNHNNSNNSNNYLLDHPNSAGNSNSSGNNNSSSSNNNSVFLQQSLSHNHNNNSSSSTTTTNPHNFSHSSPGVVGASAHLAPSISCNQQQQSDIISSAISNHIPTDYSAYLQAVTQSGLQEELSAVYSSYMSGSGANITTSSSSKMPSEQQQHKHRNGVSPATSKQQQQSQPKRQQYGNSSNNSGNSAAAAAAAAAAVSTSFLTPSLSHMYPADLYNAVAAQYQQQQQHGQASAMDYYSQSVSSILGDYAAFYSNTAGNSTLGGSTGVTGAGSSGGSSWSSAMAEYCKSLNPQSAAAAAAMAVPPGSNPLSLAAADYSSVYPYSMSQQYMYSGGFGIPK